VRRAVLGMLLLMAAACSEAEAVTLEGLASPRGLTVLEGGDLLIAEVAAGRLLRWTPGALHTSVVAEGLPTMLLGPDGAPAGVSAALRVGETYYYVVGEARAKGFRELYRLRPGEHPEGVTGQEILGLESPNRLTNPYDLAQAPAGAFYASDSGVNAVLRIDPDSSIVDYATFASRETGLAEGPPTMDVVPTGLTFGPDGALYVASLTGFPFLQGAAYVYRLADINGDGDARDPGEVSVYAEGFTAATDLAFEADGSLLVTEFSTDMAHLAEAGFGRAAEWPGRLVRWRDGAIEVVAEGLVSPTAVAISGDRVFVSEEFAGRVREVLR